MELASLWWYPPRRPRPDETRATRMPRLAYDKRNPRVCSRLIMLRTVISIGVALGALACKQTKTSPDAPKGPHREDTASASAAQRTADRPVESDAKQRGAELYSAMCAVCHGANGEGYKADLAPALAHPEFLATVSDEFLRTAI